MPATTRILMIRPVNFGFNEQTAESNAFQIKESGQDIQARAVAEFDNMVAILRQEGVGVTVIDDTPEPPTPDSIFPNNWISLHAKGTAYLYPMQAENRRTERRDEIIQKLREEFRLGKIEDLSYFENENKFLEGTGSMVLDRENKIAYACLSPRTHPDALQKFCDLSGYSSCAFHAVDEKGKAIYHTNVMMCIGEGFAVICMDSIPELTEKERVRISLTETGKEIILISFSQMNQFAGNMLELKNREGQSLLVMSERAYKSLHPDQVERLSKFARLVYAPLTTIENTGGGSARCMMAEIHLPQIS